MFNKHTGEWDLVTGDINVSSAALSFPFHHHLLPFFAPRVYVHTHTFYIDSIIIIIIMMVYYITHILSIQPFEAGDGNEFGRRLALSKNGKTMIAGTDRTVDGEFWIYKKEKESSN